MNHAKWAVYCLLAAFAAILTGIGLPYVLLFFGAAAFIMYLQREEKKLRRK